MAVFKIEKTKYYTVMSNFHLRHRDLTLKAKVYLLKYTASSKYREIRSNSENFHKILEGFERWKLKT